MTTQSPDTHDISEQQQFRRAKRQKLIDDGRGAYPARVERTTSLKDLRAAYTVVVEGEGEPADAPGVTVLAPGEETQDTVSVTGRVMFKRDTGKLCFASLQEGNGTQLQVMLSLAEVGEDALASWKDDVDLGDIVSVTGRVIASKRGEHPARGVEDLSLIHI